MPKSQRTRGSISFSRARTTRRLNSARPSHRKKNLAKKRESEVGAQRRRRTQNDTLEESCFAVDTVLDVAVQESHDCTQHRHHTCSPTTECKFKPHKKTRAAAAPTPCRNQAGASLPPIPSGGLASSAWMEEGGREVASSAQHHYGNGLTSSHGPMSHGERAGSSVQCAMEALLLRVSLQPC